MIRDSYEFNEEEFKQHNKVIEESWNDAKQVVSCDIDDIDKLDNQQFNINFDEDHR